MIVVDTSALMAIILGEPMADVCADAVARNTDVLIAAPTVTECLIVAAGRRVGEAMDRLIANAALTNVALDASRARAAANAYRRWGKGFHPAGLNMGDVFAYALAKERNCPLLFVGNDFAQTDVMSALA